MKTLIICASRYGSTMEIGHWIAQRLPWNNVDIFRVEKAPEPDKYELIILGGGVYNEQVDKRIVQYVKTHPAGLSEKKIVAFAVCLDTCGVYMKGKFFGGWLYLKPLLEALETCPPVYAGVLSGEINPKTLSDKDRGLLMHFYNKILKRDIDEVPYRTLMNKPEVWKFVEKILVRLKGQF